jgi:hypothetical protein
MRKANKWTYLFRETINSVRYTDRIFNQSFPQLTEKERPYALPTQQDLATAHTARNSLNAIFDVFGDRVFSEGLWPPRSPDLTPCDLYLWGRLEVKVYKSNPHISEELENSIREEVTKISDAELQRVNKNVFSCYNACLLENGGHF